MDSTSDSLFVNADWSALVPAGSPLAAFGITPADAKRRGLLPLVDGESLATPEVLHSAGTVPEPEPADEPEAKEAPAPDDKEADRPADKAVRKPHTK